MPLKSFRPVTLSLGVLKEGEIAIELAAAREIAVRNTFLDGDVVEAGRDASNKADTAPAALGRAPVLSPDAESMCVRPLFMRIIDGERPDSCHHL